MIAVLLTVVLIGAGGQQPATSSPAASTGASPTPTSLASTTPTLHPVVSPEPLVGKTVVTVSPDLGVRSQPRVADDSVKYDPLLPTGTELTVIGGPVQASGYTWYQVALVDLTLQGGQPTGWVAAADKDGTPWIAVRTATTPTADFAISTVPRATADPAKAKEAAAAITAFGLDLYKRMLSDGTLDAAKGAVFSPTSIALALAMARAGARGETDRSVGHPIPPGARGA